MRSNRVFININSDFTTKRMRYFFMGNALVTSIVKRIALGMEN